jgi:hypothetical protein
MGNTCRFLPACTEAAALALLVHRILLRPAHNAADGEIDYFECDLAVPDQHSMPATNSRTLGTAPESEFHAAVCSREDGNHRPDNRNRGVCTIASLSGMFTHLS